VHSSVHVLQHEGILDMTTDPSTPDASDVVIAMLRRMLRPLVRLLVSQQIPYPLLSRLLKRLYVDVASEDFALDGKRVTVSRLSLLTGIHRREVKRIQEQTPESEDAPPAAITLGAQIVARWTGEAPFVDGAGRPRALVRQSDDPSTPSFQGLVNSVSVDIHPRSVLDEWLRIGVATLTEDDRVELAANAFVPSRGFEEKAHFVGRNLRDHVAAAAHNLEADPSPFLERSVYYGDLPEAAVAELRALARDAGQEALVRVNERARVLKQEAAAGDDSPGESNRRFTFGVFEYAAPNDDTNDAPEEDDHA